MIFYTSNDVLAVQCVSDLSNDVLLHLQCFYPAPHIRAPETLPV